jgi:hypothetical protein
MICGGPHVGKSTLSRRLATAMGLDHHAIGHGDDLVDVLDWSAASAEMVTWAEQPGPWIIEGVGGGRVLRKFMAAHPGEKPCDVAYWLTNVFTPLTKKGQESMTKGCMTVWIEIAPQLEALGVEVRTRVDDLRV